MIFNSTEVSRILFVDSFEEYSTRKKDEYDEFTLYLVKSGESQIVVYYGDRRLKDALEVDSYPGTPDYPAGKFYLQTGINKDGDKFVKGVHYKYLSGNRDPEIVTFRGDCFKSFDEVDKGVAQVYFRNETGSQDILLTKDGSKISDDVVNKVVDQVNDKKDSLKLRWEIWR